MEKMGVTDAGFWRNRRVFLTGHTGFKGAWLSLWLTEMGAKLTGFALPPPTTPSLFALADVASGMTSIEGDICDLGAMQSAMNKAEPELVIHMAAQSLVRPSYNDPVGTYATNVMGTAHVLQCVRKCPLVRAVLVVTSDKCYENLETDKPYAEEDAMGGYDPYSSSKGCAELVTSSFRKSFFHPEKYNEHRVAVASVRAGNVIGGGDWAHDRLLPDAVRAFLNNKILEIRSPNSIRPWQHVLDPLNGYLQLCQQLLGDNAARYAEGWNFGPPAASEQSVKTVITEFTRQWGDGAKWHDASDAKNPHEAHYLRLNCAKAHEFLKWEPSYDLKEALALTATWYKDCHAKANVRALTIEQIKNMMHPEQNKAGKKYAAQG